MLDLCVLINQTSYPTSNNDAFGEIMTNLEGQKAAAQVRQSYITLSQRPVMWDITYVGLLGAALAAAVC